MNSRPLSLWRMASVTPDLRLPSQPQSITAPWPVPNYTAWWQRHMCVNDFFRVTTWQCNGWESNSTISRWRIQRPTTTLPSHPLQKKWEQVTNHAYHETQQADQPLPYMEGKVRLHIMRLSKQTNRCHIWKVRWDCISWDSASRPTAAIYGR